ncbi:MAG: flagellar hook-basal body complex protein, partial [Candidatus Marinimicrobia bacterium]|nr:flagellar hook-basal body complex protein [Candidatus Neomarinimicrobiota bacterium]
SDFTGSISAVMVAATGEIEFTNNSGGSLTIAITSTNLNLDKALSAADGTLANAAKSQTDEFSHVAKDTDLLIDLRDDTGTSLGLVATDVIRANGSVGGTAITEGTVTVTSTMTYSDLAEQLETIFRIKSSDGITIGSSDGSLSINGDGGLINELSGLTVTAEDSGGTQRANFDAIFDDSAGNWFEAQSATDFSQSASITVFDSKGESYVVSIKFIKDPIEVNKWRWESSIEGLTDDRLSGSTGEITFDSEGNLKTFTYDGGASSFRFLPESGANVVEIKFDSGTFGEIDGLSQFDGSPNAIANEQNGYTVGELSHITVDTTGVISGVYTNGVAQKLAQVVLATFNNPTGLVRVGDNLYDVSGNSGQAVVGEAGSTIQSTITSGALELSNVDLVEEFTKMIIAQRGFQANARVTTVSDRILEEVVRLKQ